jgi:hypothetical protein
MAIERVIRYAFERARERHHHLVSVTKSNASRFAYVLWDEVAAGLSSEYPDVRVERVHVDAIAARMVLRPQSIGVVVASNLFADILTDLGAALQGGLGLAASANLNPEHRHPSMFEPVADAIRTNQTTCWFNPSLAFIRGDGSYEETCVALERISGRGPSCRDGNRLDSVRPQTSCPRLRNPWDSTARHWSRRV